MRIRHLWRNINVRILESKKWSSKEIWQYILHVCIALGAIGSVIILGLQLKTLNDQNAAMWYANRPIIKNQLMTLYNPVAISGVDTIKFDQCDADSIFRVNIYSNFINIGESPAQIDSINYSFIFCNTYVDSFKSEYHHIVVPNDTFVYPVFQNLHFNDTGYIKIEVVYRWDNHAGEYEDFRLSKIYSAYIRNNEVSLKICPEIVYDSLLNDISG